MRSLVLVAAIAAVTATAQAQPSEYAEGERLYRAGHYLAAAEQFQAAYAADPDPSYLFNIGQAFRLGGKCAEASNYYKLYLARAVNAPNVDAVQGYIAQMDECAVGQRPPPPPPKRTTRIVDTGSTWRVVGIAVAASGVAALGAAAWFTHDVNVLEGYRADICPAPPEPCNWTPQRAAREDDLASRGRRASILAITLYAAGGALLAGGATLYVIGRRSHEVIVVPEPGGAVVGAAFAF